MGEYQDYAYEVEREGRPESAGNVDDNGADDGGNAKPEAIFDKEVKPIHRCVLGCEIREFAGKASTHLTQRRKAR